MALSSAFRRFDHVGITVADLYVVTGFFVALGLEVEGRAFVEGEFLETVCGIPDSRTEIVMLKWSVSGPGRVAGSSTAGGVGARPRRGDRRRAAAGRPFAGRSTRSRICLS